MRAPLFLQPHKFNSRPPHASAHSLSAIPPICSYLHPISLPLCSEYERKAKLDQFQGSSAISSADYFGDGPKAGGRTPSGDMDLSASDLVNRLSVQAKQDLQSMGQLAGNVGSKLYGLGSKLMSDLGRGY